VGKRVDPGQRYFAENDRFYVDFSEDNPFLALEAYGQRLKQAQRVQLSTYDFPTVCLWYAMHWNYGNGPAVNDSPGSVAEMDRIANSGFLRYAPAAVRLVPDCYDANNEQGWWDDAHWQRHGSGSGANDIKVKRHYQAPYETSEKWGRAITRRGGVPITYFKRANARRTTRRRFRNTCSSTRPTPPFRTTSGPCRAKPATISPTRVSGSTCGRCTPTCAGVAFGE
jgi:hypothetical protein